jgi:plastocyanin
VGTFAAAAAILLALTTGSAQAATVTVAAMNYEFQPATRTIAVGDVVRWTFSGEPHSVTSRDGLFDSGVTNPGGSFQFTFATAGTYRYYCQVHPEQMFGTIVVKAAAPTATLRSTPSPTIRPTTRPTAAPTPTPTPSPAPSATPITPPVSSPSPSPAAAETAGASPRVVASALPSVPPASPGPLAPSSTSAGDSVPVAPLAVIVLGVLVVGGLVVARRRRAT